MEVPKLEVPKVDLPKIELPSGVSLPKGDPSLPSIKLPAGLSLPATPSGPPGGAVTPSQFGGLEYLGAGAAAGLVPAGALIALRSFLVSKRGLNND